MEIRPSSFRIKDDFGLIIDVKPIKDKIDVEVANVDITNFFGNYRIVSAFKDLSNTIDKKKEIKPEAVQPLKTIGQRKPRSAKFLPMNRIIWLVKNLKSPFGMKDFVECQAEDFDAYSYEDKDYMWKSVIAHLRKYKLVEVTTPAGTPRNSYKYRYIGSENDTDNKINLLKEGNKVILESMK